MMQFIKKWATLLVLSLALAIIIIDTTILNVSLGTIIREFHTDIQSLQWVITAYSLTLAALTITGGRLGDLFGRKKMFILGAVLFAIGSFITAISQSIPVLLLGESLIEGVGAALMMPATASLLVANYSGRDRGIAFGFWGGIAGAASAIGPILGGYLTTNFTWRWGFLINDFVVLILLLGSIIIKESHDTEEKPTLDLVGVFLSAFGLLGVVFGIIESSTYGWWTAKSTFPFLGYSLQPFGLSIVPFSLGLGLVFLLIFFLWEQHMEKMNKTPLVSLSLFRNKTFRIGVATIAIVSFQQVGIIFILPVFLQSVLKVSALATGIALLPFSLVFLIVAPLSGIFSNKITPKYIILTGLCINIFGMFSLRMSISPDTTIETLILPFVLLGTGLGMVMAQISNMTLSSVSVQQAGEASGVNNTLRQIGSSLGSAILGAALLTTLSTNVMTGVYASTKIPETTKPMISKVVSKQTSNIEFGGGAKVDRTTPPAVIKEIERITKQATANATKQALLYTTLIALLGLVTASFLPKISPGHKRGDANPNSAH